MKFFKALCLTATTSLFLCCPMGTCGIAEAQEFTRSTIPLKSGGSMTSIQSQGRNVAYLSSDAQTRTADARNAVGFNSNAGRRETGFVQSPNQSTNSFYRQVQQSGSSSDSGAGRYPYPAAANSNSGNVGSGFNSSFSAASNRADNGQANLRFDRSGIGERPSGALGDTSQADGNAANRVAQLPQPPAQLPAAQLPPSLNPTLPNPTAALPAAATVPTFGGRANCNCGPNYVNPAANYASGYQGYQPLPQAANSVPALNVQFPQRQAQATSPYCCAPQPQPQAPLGGYTAYQFQPNVGTPQFGANNNPWWSSFLTGSGQYTPLIQFRNMPPGTYLGQGLIGQPTAYVDGQPIRNLLRYVSP